MGLGLLAGARLGTANGPETGLLLRKSMENGFGPQMLSSPAGLQSSELSSHKTMLPRAGHASPLTIPILFPLLKNSVNGIIISHPWACTSHAPGRTEHGFKLFLEQDDAEQCPHPIAPSPTEQQSEGPFSVTINGQELGHSRAMATTMVAAKAKTK